MMNDSDVAVALGSFFDEGWISEVLYEVKSGKEATVYCCRGGPRMCDRDQNRDRQGADPAQHQFQARPLPHGRGSDASSAQAMTALLAAKVYRPLESRRFRNDAMYQAGRLHLAREGRAKRATQAKSSFGREVQYATWMDQEWSTLHALHRAGADVPRALARNDRAILMPFLGDENGGAPNLNEAELDRAEIQAVAERLLWNIELMLDAHIVHGDLSPYNVLFWNAKATIIDLPQAVDPRLNPAAHMLLARDIENICLWAAKRGAPASGGRHARAITAGLWSRFVLGEIG
jgi:RIO kinase 1